LQIKILGHVQSKCHDNFLTKMMQTASLQSKGQKRVGLCTGVEVWEQGQNVQETATSWSPGGRWWM